MKRGKIIKLLEISVLLWKREGKLKGKGPS